MCYHYEMDAHGATESKADKTRNQADHGNQTYAAPVWDFTHFPTAVLFAREVYFFIIVRQAKRTEVYLIS